MTHSSERGLLNTASAVFFEKKDVADIKNNMYDCNDVSVNVDWILPGYTLFYNPTHGRHDTYILRRERACFLLFIIIIIYYNTSLRSLALGVRPATGLNRSPDHAREPANDGKTWLCVHTRPGHLPIYYVHDVLCALYMYTLTGVLKIIHTHIGIGVRVRTKVYVIILSCFSKR